MESLGMTKDGIFDSVQLSDEQKQAIADLKKSAYVLYYDIVTAVPQGRMRSLALTKLEECLMWANKGIAHEWQS